MLVSSTYKFLLKKTTYEFQMNLQVEIESNAVQSEENEAR